MWQQYVFSLTLKDLCTTISDTAEEVSDDFALGTTGAKDAPFSDCTTLRVSDPEVNCGVHQMNKAAVFSSFQLT